MGAVKGTDQDLCNLVGGMSPGRLIKIKATDGFTKEFAYKNVYTPPSRQVPMVITWNKDSKYPYSGYDEGMKGVFLPTLLSIPGENTFLGILTGTNLQISNTGTITRVAMRNIQRPPGFLLSMSRIS